MTSSNRLTVIIVVKDDIRIEQTLAALKHQHQTHPFECLVVDASEPAVMAGVRARQPWVRWEQYPVSRERTTPHQRNRGLELATTPYIAFIDANCIPAPDWVSRIILNLDGGEDIVTGPIDELGTKGMVRYDGAEMKPHYVGECATINVGFKRAVYVRTGGFDTTFRFGQDIDFFWRATDAGFKIRFEPGISIAHDFGAASEQLHRAYAYGFARARLFAKHWTSRRGQLLSESHVWVYPVFLLGLPITVIFPAYPLLLAIPFVRNLRRRPFGTVAHHLVYGAGVLVSTIELTASSLVGVIHL